MYRYPSLRALSNSWGKGSKLDIVVLEFERPSNFVFTSNIFIFTMKPRFRVNGISMIFY